MLDPRVEDGCGDDALQEVVSEPEPGAVEEVPRNGGETVASKVKAAEFGSGYDLGFQLPILQQGGDLIREYLKGVGSDETLKKWKKWADEKKNGFFWEDGLLKKLVEDTLTGNRELLAISKNLRLSMLHVVHDQLVHVSGTKAIATWVKQRWVKQRCVWPGMNRIVKKYVKDCVACQCMRKEKVGEAPYSEVPVYDVPFQQVAIDIVGLFPRQKGYTYLLTYMCLSSRYSEAICMIGATTQECAEAILEIFSRNGVQLTLLSDQGTQFMGCLLKNLCKALGVKQIWTTSYHPQLNGAVKRFHGTLVPMLRKLCKDDVSWTNQLKFALFGVRSTPNRSTGYSLFEIVYGRNLNLPFDLVLQEIQPGTVKNVKAVEWLDQLRDRVKATREIAAEHLKAAQEAIKAAHAEKAVTRSFVPGDMVLVRLPGLYGKLEGAWEEPYEVLEVPTNLHVVVAMAGKGKRKGGTGNVFM